ncbi:MAG: TatD family hydrolase [Nitrososphaeria archaeon]
MSQNGDPGGPELPAADNHAHANPVRGLGAREIARRFRASGGALLVLVALPTWSLGLSPGSRDDLEVSYRAVLKSVQEVREEGLLGAAILGLHPAEVAELLRAGRSPAEVLEFGGFSVELAARMVDEGLAAGYGEYGRPHWDAGPSVVDLCDRITMMALEAARDHGGVVHVHSERANPDTVRRMSSMASAAGVDQSRIVLHHALPSSVEPASAAGMIPSVPAGRKGELEDAVPHGPGFVIESDFMDDPDRPGAVISPWALSKRVHRLIRSGVMSPDFYINILGIYKKLYDMDPISGLRGTS